MKLKRLFIYIGSAILLFSLLYLVVSFISKASGLTTNVYDSSLFWYYSSVLFVIIGLMLGLEYFINQMKNEGKWSIDLIRLTIIALPCLYFSLSSLPHLIARFWFPNTPTITPLGFLVHISEILLGYAIITSLRKKVV